ncbi:hypothetical protein LTR10_019866 [Elasticomyces elasticus]|uniref:C2H2-type domain-containing protein n=1 Tax=Exophiala sideris TaxID=1016849 RepID=A0ABR0IXN1_9EURO|nr:hypothetical protein LTR10_019866 [Elasticomyces elasticus]KAK5022410.1 hypothetical protein LTS07_010070 [Exophiala sideris]KAK5027232.1 hypothetical protein LTR13_009627 [Exophiala sideris]KAK5051264.1 hypothetical protein LTR69_010290 [Exophiala sideris]KAK5177772.1 hypothetical protein LTR44_009747 [Eurotiomycetes sp. CCFEE 6388]
MHPHPLNLDLLGSEGIDYLHGSYSYDQNSSYWDDQGDLSCINPLLPALQHEYTYPNVHARQNIDTQLCFSTYNPAAHGFSHGSRHHGQNVPCQFDPVDPWDQDVTQYRQLRYLSPTDLSGFSLPSTTSSVSEYALSPDVTRSVQDLSFVQASSPSSAAFMSMPVVSHHPWATQPTVMQAPVAATPTKHAALSMRDFQMTPDPDPEVEQEFADDSVDTLHAKIHLPEELELSEQLASPPDSALDYDESTLHDAEEASGVLQSDSDSDFHPTGQSGRRNTTISRHSLRTPRQQAPRGIIDSNSRVHKPSSASRHHAGPVSSSRSKSKRVTRSKKKEQGAKLFPCTFHHYGCIATFASKNEWKRHVASQHLQLGFFRCDMGSCSQDDVRGQQRGCNDFNRKDLFTQHCRRMHAPWVEQKKNEKDVTKKEKEAFEKQLDNIRARCWVDSRDAPVRSACGFCRREFVDGENSGSVSAWDQRMEHVGRHFEREGFTADREAVDEGLRQWALAYDVVRAGRRKGEYVLTGLPPERPRDRTPAGRRRSGRVANAVKKEELDDSDDEGSIEVRHAGVPLHKVEHDSDDDAEVEVEAEEDGESDEDVDADAEAEDD